MVGYPTTTHSGQALLFVKAYVVPPCKMVYTSEAYVVAVATIGSTRVTQSDYQFHYNPQILINLTKVRILIDPINFWIPEPQIIVNNCGVPDLPFF
jgi:hypothetical protein